MRARLVMSFVWMVVLAALSSSSASSLLNETRIEAFDIDQFINEIRGNEDANQLQSGAFDIKKYLEIRATPEQCPDELLIAAFNIQTLSENKLKNTAVMNIIYKIISQYHVILIQEVRCDERKLVKELNRNREQKYTAWASEELGTWRYDPKRKKYVRSYWEKYVFLIRDGSGISVEDIYQFEQDRKLFERPPFSIRLECADARLFGRRIKFVLTAIHAKPDAKKAEAEITHLLKDVYGAIIYKWKDTNNILIMGDLNAGYLSRDAITRLKTARDQKGQTFYWPLRDDIATMVKTKKPHDRFIMTEDMKTLLVPYSAKVFEFDKKYVADFWTITAYSVSDHYPIELKLKLTG